MRVPDDIAKKVKEVFPGVDSETALELLLNTAVLDTYGGPRLLRCALVASKGSIEALEHYVKLLAVHPRDVILAAEYKEILGKLTRVRDLSSPFRSRLTIVGGCREAR